VTVTNGGSEANYVSLWTLLDRDPANGARLIRINAIHS
jgi:hypothetical protein